MLQVCSGSVQIYCNLSHEITKLSVMYSVNHKRVFTPFRYVPARIIEAINHFSNLNNCILIYRNVKLMSRRFCKSICHCWVERTIDSLYYSSRNISLMCDLFFFLVFVLVPPPPFFFWISEYITEKKTLLFNTKTRNSASVWG